MGTPDRPTISSATTLDSGHGGPASTEERGPDIIALVIAWSSHEPDRVGEIAVLAPSSSDAALGRGADDVRGEPRVRFWRQRPGTLGQCPPLSSPSLSRRQLLVRPTERGLRLERVGRCPMLVNGIVRDVAEIVPGDVVQLRSELVLLCVERQALIPPVRFLPASAMAAFGEVDPLGLLGESPAMWALRERIAFAAKTPNHVLVHGDSGTGKELVARALHALSADPQGPFVSRSAATLPEGLIDAELFGNVRNYPNPGMPERAGLIGEADGGTLFLDEVGELPPEQQAHLLRVLDRDGEYQRLGEGRVRRSTFRFVAATNRDPRLLKHDFAARMTLRIDVPSLAERREDIPLLAAHLLERAARSSPAVAASFVEARHETRPRVRVDPALIEMLLARAYRTNVRELEAILWQAIAESQSDRVSAPSASRASTKKSRMVARARGEEEGSRAPSLEEITTALAEHGGSIPRAARALGLTSRFALNRLVKHHGLDVARMAAAAPRDGSGGRRPKSAPKNAPKNAK
ncbi:sigma-54-dependent transcriptional regulator [Labilithrix luteola]|uniref:Sigma-54-dependent transcriptional regulator n=1 Tax=Labilithrix luteola TaxID=1391654 RepID=A0A0K1QF37_9BACT|nr:sigma 54-interacting transcriptional regulator [Labilithrix luteola]AKV04386.1 sigma-54-dependent transcriptional regulator [Labilithrix luteola]